MNHFDLNAKYFDDLFFPNIAEQYKFKIIIQLYIKKCIQFEILCIIPMRLTFNVFNDEADVSYIYILPNFLIH
jgi:hypothetical protein